MSRKSQVFVTFNLVYDTLYPVSLNIVPNDEIAEKWRADYDKMRMFMIYGNAPLFDEIIAYLKYLNARIASSHYTLNNSGI